MVSPRPTAPGYPVAEVSGPSPVPPSPVPPANPPRQPRRPTVHISIGRIEIRAQQAESPKPQRTTGSRRNVLELDDYLRTRKGG
ncbi:MULTISPECIES: hypothetical protein [unclassified Crossiella]|uniref:hypothetical protein n=1 Tax=unclassified Crossiella TaxID=2620835 RepID=UPI001FFFAA6C|nr:MULTISPECIES: hypothetical protein [unclassified Crossiella]MCK2242799.1 hypothetical protein [Crossiella sp. S99.2]MCK2256676.1 hypothetical protein [Crossiella sp. S99.1]